MRIFCIVLLVCMGLHSAAQTGQKSKGMASYTFKAAYADRYVFRGHLFHDDPTAFGEFGLGIASWSYNLFYAKPVDATPGLFEEEYNHSISYTTIQGGRVTTIGYQVFNYDGVTPDTQEFFTRISHLTKWRPTYGLAYDFDTYKGFYADFSITRNLPLTNRIRVEFSILGGLSYDMTEERDSEDRIIEPGFYEGDGFTDASARLKLDWQPLNWLRLETGLRYYQLLDDLLHQDPTVDKSFTVWRSAVTIRFP